MSIQSAKKGLIAFSDNLFCANLVVGIILITGGVLLGPGGCVFIFIGAAFIVDALWGSMIEGVQAYRKANRAERRQQLEEHAERPQPSSTAQLQVSLIDQMATTPSSAHLIQTVADNASLQSPEAPSLKAEFKRAISNMAKSIEFAIWRMAHKNPHPSDTAIELEEIKKPNSIP